MANKLYPYAVRKLLADEAFENDMKAIIKAYQSGDRSALFDAITLCAQYQAIIPDWITVELMHFQSENYQQNAFGEVDPDFNEFFGSNPPNLSQREYNNAQKLKRLSKIERRVMDGLVKHRWDGGSFNLEVGIAGVAEQLALPRREVEAVYRKHKELLKELKKLQGNAGIYVNPVFPLYKRTGRSILSRQLVWGFEEAFLEKDTKP
ncbi:MAG: hypothetical protein ACTILN_06450 [Marinobacter sp.]